MPGVVPSPCPHTNSCIALPTLPLLALLLPVVQMYLFCLFMRVLLSWFPGIDWNAQPWAFLRLVSSTPPAPLCPASCLRQQCVSFEDSLMRSWVTCSGGRAEGDTVVLQVAGVPAVPPCREELRLLTRASFLAASPCPPASAAPPSPWCVLCAPPPPHPPTPAPAPHQITEPYLQIYRGILPPLFGQLDFTPLLGFLILQDVVEVMTPTYTMGLHDVDTSTKWTTSDVLCYFDGF